MVEMEILFLYGLQTLMISVIDGLYICMPFNYHCQKPCYETSKKHMLPFCFKTSNRFLLCNL